ncbi:MAG: hypothetical protein AXA67_12015 [Methylothermaceae bacteria B42]|nr:MAG: hypothetical protein AXA67_12015 [Methylothermaceae bacteria B42]HHJ39256.1 DUF4304 domain-containing protein [Methylothermaceae bacterium]
MARNPDYLNKYIKQLLLTVVDKDGFALYKPKVFMRVKGPFVDTISFQVSQYGDKCFHIHYYKNLIAYPFLDINSYTVGNRLSDNRLNGDETEWCGFEEEQAKLAIESVINAYNKTIRPWFSAVSTIPEYIFEIVSQHNNKGFSSLESAIAFAEGGKRNRAWWICSDLVNDEEEDEEIGDDEKEEIRLHKRACQQYLDASEAESFFEMKTDSAGNSQILQALTQLPKPNSEVKSVDALLEIWRDQNIEKFKLLEYVA